MLPEKRKYKNKLANKITTEKTNSEKRILKI